MDARGDSCRSSITVALAALFVTVAGCGLVDRLLGHQDQTRVFTFTIGFGDWCPQVVVVRTDSPYACPNILDAAAGWHETTFNVDIKGVRKDPGRGCLYFDFVGRLTWRSCFTPSGDAYHIVLGYQGQSAEFSVTAGGGTISVKRVSGGEFIDHVPWWEWGHSE